MTMDVPYTFSLRRHIHLVEADVHSDCPCHEQVVVFSRNSTEGTTDLFIGDVFVETPHIPFDVHGFSDDLYKRGYDHRLGADVRIEALFARHLVDDVILALFAGIHVIVHTLNLIQNIERLIAVDIPVFIFGLGRIAFDHQ